MKFCMVIHEISDDYYKSGIYSDGFVYKYITDACKNKSYLNIPPSLKRESWIREFSSSKQFNTWKDT